MLTWIERFPFVCCGVDQRERERERVATVGKVVQDPMELIQEVHALYITNE